MCGCGSYCVIGEKTNGGELPVRPEEKVVSYLKERGLTLFTAESCTGGLVCKRITDVPGASSVLKGGVVSYTNGIKISLLGVSPAMIEQYTEVSEQCAAEMAQCAVRLSGADIGVSATGYASGGAGVPDGMTGVVFIGYSDRNGTKVKKLRLNGSREEVREAAVDEIFGMITGCSSERKENEQ